METLLYRFRFRGVDVAQLYVALLHVEDHISNVDYQQNIFVASRFCASICYIKTCPMRHVRSLADKTVKLWKIREKQMKKVTTPASNAIKEGMRHAKRGLALPQVSVAGTAVATSLRRVFANAHTYHVNSVDPNSDGEHFISADDLRINMWNLEITDRSFSKLVLPHSNVSACATSSVCIFDEVKFTHEPHLEHDRSCV